MSNTRCAVKKNFFKVYVELSKKKRKTYIQNHFTKMRSLVSALFIRLTITILNTISFKEQQTLFGHKIVYIVLIVNNAV